MVLFFHPILILFFFFFTIVDMLHSCHAVLGLAVYFINAIIKQFLKLMDYKSSCGCLPGEILILSHLRPYIFLCKLFYSDHAFLQLSSLSLWNLEISRHWVGICFLVGRNWAKRQLIKYAFGVSSCSWGKGKVD